jgi:hypothetical protein
MQHVHRWSPDLDCDGVLTLGGRAVPCHARCCATPGCQMRREPPGDFCKEHLGLGRRLVMPSTTT